VLGKWTTLSSPFAHVGHAALALLAKPVSHLYLGCNRKYVIFFIFFFEKTGLIMRELLKRGEYIKTF
jgi:hypothetical protein